MNVHTPERQPDESLSEYHSRQRTSRFIAEAMRRGPTQAPAISPLDVSRFWLGQHTNPSKRRGDKPPRDFGQHPKFAKERKRKEYRHPQRDELGAFTLVGKAGVRRKWVAGVNTMSA